MSRDVTRTHPQTLRELLVRHAHAVVGVEAREQVDDLDAVLVTVAPDCSHRFLDHVVLLHAPLAVHVRVAPAHGEVRELVDHLVLFRCEFVAVDYILKH